MHFYFSKSKTNNSVHIFRTEYRLKILDKLEKIIFPSSIKPWQELQGSFKMKL